MRSVSQEARRLQSYRVRTAKASLAERQANPELVALVRPGDLYELANVAAVADKQSCFCGKILFR